MNLIKSWSQRAKALWVEFQKTQQEREENEFLPAVLEVTETPPSPVARIVLWTLMLMLVLGLLWTIFGNVDEVG